MKRIEYLFKDSAHEDKLLKAFELLEQFANSCSDAPDKEIEQKKLEFVHFICLSMKEEPRISLQQEKNLDMNEMNKDFLALLLLRLKCFLTKNSDIELTRDIIIQARNVFLTLLRAQDVDAYEIILT